MAQDKTKQLEIERLENKIEKLYDVIDTYDAALGSLSGMLTAALGEENISDWQARGIIRCSMATAVYYADSAKKELELVNE